MKFRLIAGVHIGTDPTDTRELKLGERRREIHYNVGDVIESDTDLADRFGSQKFAPIYENNARQAAPQVPRNTNPGVVVSPEFSGTPQNPVETSEEIHHGAQAQELADKKLTPTPPTPVSQDGLDGLDEKKLRDLAVSEKIKVNGADSKEKLVEAIRKARGPRA